MPGGPSLAEAKRRTSQPLPASRFERVFREWPNPWAPVLATPAACEWPRRGAGRQRQLPGAGEGLARPRSRPPPGLRRKRGLWRGGAAAPRQGPRLPAPCGARPCWNRPLAAGAPAKQRWRLVSFSPVAWRVHAGSVARPEPTRVRLAVHLLVAHTAPSTLAGPSSETSLSGVCHLQDPETPTPASRQALTSRMGPCFSSRTIRAPPLPAIFLGGHLQRFRGDFLSAGTKLVTPLITNTRENQKLKTWQGITTSEKTHGSKCAECFDQWVNEG